MRKAAVLFLLIALIACASSPRPTAQQLNSADYGPFPENWKQVASDTIAEELVRPEDLYIRKIDPPVKSWVATPDGEMLYAWGVCGMIVVGRGSLESFFVMVHDGKPIYKALGYNITKRIPGKTWTHRGSSVKAYDNCPNLFKN